MFKWIQEADAYMYKEYGIDLIETGITDVEFYSRFGDSGSIDPAEAVEIYADNYGLTPLRR